MKRSAIEGITSRLASMEGLYFPGAIHRQAPDPSQRKTALLDLLSRDAPIFLERYGSELTADELREFEVLKADYEVEWHLNRLRRGRSPTAEEARARSVTVKNRRRAYMELLIRGGEYFSEDAMREREPYLHHEYLGRFQDPFGRVLSRPGERWSETLMRRCEEAMLVEKIRREQRRLGVARRDWVGGGGEKEQQEEDEEREEEEDDEDESEQVKGEEKGGSSESRMSLDDHSKYLEEIKHKCLVQYYRSNDSSSWKAD
ncbi:putative coiled-coil domain-containing protein 97 [Cocos nucifera]|uniref:Putative coiled-coil domain-containing protein 97 n=1 Tax=Cocos nucifera TaxID=13894 RepID=A0A8K0IHH7_COCNU|nr:putative coiled-coil domain-containing protein 97 [Cocos nucifera]